MMEGGGGHYDDQIDIEGSCRSKVNTKVDDPVDDEPSLSHEEIDNKNPFQIQVILDVVFKMLAFEDVKKFRLVSSTWNDVATGELSKRPQNPIGFISIVEDNDNKMVELIQLQRRHSEIFPDDHHQLFSSFFFNASKLTPSPQIEQFFQNFRPKCVKFVGTCGSLIPIQYDSEEKAVKEEKNKQLQEDFCKFLVQISPSVEKISFLFNFSLYIKTRDYGYEHIRKVTSTSFPNLRKISYALCTSKLEELFFYPLIGQNSPNLKQLRWEAYEPMFQSIYPSDETTEYLVESLEDTGLMSKLKILEITQVNAHILKGFRHFAQNGQLKLTKLKFENDNSVRRNKIFTSLIETQSDSLKILELTLEKFYSKSKSKRIRVQFPPLQNLTYLQIDNFSSFEVFYEPINFSIQFPKLEKFKTYDIKTFLGNNLGHGGESVKFVSIYMSKNQNSDDDDDDDDNDEDEDSDESNDDNEKKSVTKSVENEAETDFIKFGQIFPNLEFLELGFDSMPSAASAAEGLENLPFWSQLRKVIIHCQLKDLPLFKFKKPLLKVIRKLDIIVKCENNMMDEDSYKNYLGGLMKLGEKVVPHLYYYNREKFYKKYLINIAKIFKSLHTASFTIIGYKISEDFKRDFRGIFPEADFVSSDDKPPDDNAADEDDA